MLGVLNSSCTFNNIHVNEEVEREQAESIIGSFYYALQTKRFADAEALFSETFYKKTKKEDLHKILVKTQEMLGDYKDGTLVDWKTRRISGSNSLTEYLLVYHVRYNNHKATETVGLIREKEEIRIVEYRIASEGFQNLNRD